MVYSEGAWKKFTPGLILKTYVTTTDLLVQSVDYCHQYNFLHSYIFDNTHKTGLSLNAPLVHQPFLQVHQQVERAVLFSVAFLQDLPGMETHHHHHIF